jgi:hypothetical protein
MGDEELTEFIEAQGEVVRELERQLLPPPAPKQRKGATKQSRSIVSPSHQAGSAMRGRYSMRRSG